MTQFAKIHIMAHTKIFSIKLSTKTHFIKYLQWFYKGHNLACKLQLANPRHHRAPYHVQSTIIWVVLYSNTFVCYKHLFTGVQKWQLYKCLRHLMALFLQLAFICLKKPICYWNHHFMSWMVHVPTPYIKVSISYGCIIKCV